MPCERIESERNTLIIEDEVLRKGFTSTPNYILDDVRVSIAARFTYITLLSFAWQEESCFPGQTRLAKAIGVTDRAVRKYLSELIQKEYIKVSRRGLGRTNVYHILRVKLPVSKAERNERSAQDRNRRTAPERHALSDKEYPAEEDTDPSKFRMVQNLEKQVGGNHSRAISRMVEGLSKRELHDAVHVRSNITRALNLWRQSKLSEAQFMPLVQQARTITLARAGSIRKTVEGYRGTKNRAPYFFKVLQDLMQKSVVNKFRAKFGSKTV